MACPYPARCPADHSVCMPCLPAAGVFALSLHDALPICPDHLLGDDRQPAIIHRRPASTEPTISPVEVIRARTGDHTSELQSRPHVVCRRPPDKANRHIPSPPTLPAPDPDLRGRAIGDPC